MCSLAYTNECVRPWMWNLIDFIIHLYWCAWRNKSWIDWSFKDECCWSSAPLLPCSAVWKQTLRPWVPLQNRIAVFQAALPAGASPSPRVTCPLQHGCFFPPLFAALSSTAWLISPSKLIYCGKWLPAASFFIADPSRESHYHLTPF